MVSLQPKPQTHHRVTEGTEIHRASAQARPGAGQNVRHTSFDSAGFRNRFVTELPRARIPDHELAPAPAAKNGARKSPCPAPSVEPVEAPDFSRGSTEL